MVSAPNVWELHVSNTLHRALAPAARSSFLRLESCVAYKDSTWLVSTYKRQVSLQDVINCYRKANKKMDEPLIMFYATELLRAVEALHATGVLHADIKPDNILINEAKNQVKVCDFGSAMLYDEIDGPTPLLVSRFYRAPEIMMGHWFDYSIDLWAVACTMFELYTGKILFNERDNNQMLRAQMELKGKCAKKFIRAGLPQIRDEHFDDKKGRNLQTIHNIIEDLPKALKTALVSGKDGSIPKEVLDDVLE